MMRIHDVIAAYGSALSRARQFVEFHAGSEVPDAIEDLPEDVIAALDALPDANAFQTAFDEVAGQLILGLSATVDDFRRRERELLEASNRSLERARAAEEALAAVKGADLKVRTISMPIRDISFGGRVATHLVAAGDGGECELRFHRHADAVGLRPHDRITILLPGEARDA